jgi:cyclopropane-fatty-acyl-phospholipid synthase
MAGHDGHGQGLATMALRNTTLTGPTFGHFPTALSLALRRTMLLILRRIEVGTLTVTLPSGVSIHHRGVRPGPEGVLLVRRWRALLRLLLAGDLGLARAYMDDDCHSPDLRALLEFGARNAPARSKLPSDFPLAHSFDRIRHALRANTQTGSRHNIAAHYDLGNDFYALWLDRGMNYSSALFTEAGQTLEQAQDAKLSRIVELLDLKAGQHVLEIGCGWGPLAERLTVDTGCSVTGVTLSAAQLDFAQARLHRRTPSKNWDLRLQDYRDIDGRYDRVVSIEMLEAVGERFWPIYFDKLRQSLTDTGIAVLQVITIAESRFAAYRRRPDFIQRYIFPGGMLPTLEIIRQQARRAGLHLVTQQSFGTSYAKTLAEWRQRFLQAWPCIEALGFDARFKRMWEYYLSYCEVGFAVDAIDVSLIKLVPAR